MQRNRNINVFEENTLKPTAHFYSSNETIVNDYLSLNGKWDFLLSDDETIKITNLNFNKQITVPSNIEMNGYLTKQYVNIQYPWEGKENLVYPEIPQENYVGIYQKYVTLDSKWISKTTIIEFEGVESAFEFYINDNYVGYSEDSHTPTKFDISNFVNEGKNKFTVKVFKYSTASWLEDQDCWRFFGIHRPINLYCKNKEYIKDIKTTQIFSDDLKQVKLNVAIDVDQTLQYQCILSNQLFTSETFTNDLIIDDVILWDVDHPNLYDLQVNLIKDEQIIEIAKLKIGFRKIIIEDNIIKLNNKRIFFKGINRHDFSRSNGKAVTKAEMEWDVRFIKSHNFNALRTSHYPNQSYLYELCDQYGLLVIDETNLETHGTWQMLNDEVSINNVLPDDNSLCKEAVLKRAINMYERDKNHACIIMWSCGNESYGGETLFEMSQYFRSVDPSRIVHYEGIYWDRRLNDTSDVESRMYPKFEDMIDYLENDASKPYILCEYSHAMGNSNGNIHKYIELGKKYPHFQGGFIWEMFEHTLTKDNKIAFGGSFDDRPNDYFFVVDGIVQGDRKTTPKADYIKYVQQPFKFKLKENKVYITNAFDYKDVYQDYKIICNGKTYLPFIKNGEDFIIEIDPSIDYVNLKIVDVNNVFDFDDTIIARKSYILNKNKTVKKTVDLDNLEIIEGSYTIGFKGRNFNHIFSKTTNKLASIKYNDAEFVNNVVDTLTPNFWRCPTNNDIGAGKHFELAEWRTASYHAPLELVSFNDNVIVTKIKDYPIYVEYQFADDGDINVKMYNEMMIGKPDMFCFGMRMNFAKQFKCANYLGNGPIESYCDRQENLSYGNYSLKLDKEYKYAVPQEFGNRTNCQEVEIFNENNQGLKIISDQMFEFSYKDTPDELLEYSTNNGYVASNTNQLKIHSMMSGVAGDDSWGKWCHEEYIVKPNKTHHLVFTIKSK